MSHMKILSSLFLSLLFLFAYGQEEVDLIEAEHDTTDEQVLSFVIVERMPEIQGCEGNNEGQEGLTCFQSAVMTHVSKTVKYPKEAIEQGLQGRVILKFIIEKDGTVSHIETVRGVHPLLDNEAIKSIQSLKILGPASQRGKPVRMEFMLPVSFSFK